MMKKNDMLQKVNDNNGIYDTRKFRYVSNYLGHTLMRCPIEYIGTTEGVNWEIVIKQSKRVVARPARFAPCR